MAAFLPYLMAAQTAMSVIGAISSGNAQAKQEKRQAERDRQNAQIAANNASQARAEASSEEDRLRIKQRIARGNQIAATAESGIGFEGTGGDLIEQSDINAEMDNLAIRYQGETRARNYDQQSSDFTEDSQVSLGNAKSAKSGIFANVAGAVINGASSYSQYQRLYGK